MKKWVWPKVMAFMALFWILISLFSVGILFIFSPKQENDISASVDNMITQEDLNKLVEEYNRTNSWSNIESGSWMELKIWAWVTSSWVIDELPDESGTWEEL